MAIKESISTPFIHNEKLHKEQYTLKNVFLSSCGLVYSHSIATEIMKL